MLLYVAEAWYPVQHAHAGRSLPRRVAKDREPRQEDENGTLNVSSGYPISLEDDNEHREAGILPGSLLLEMCQTAFAARHKALDEAHPFMERTMQSKLPAMAINEIKRLPKTASALPD